MNALPSLLMAHRNLRWLVVSQALYVCCSAIGLTLTGLVGAMLSPSRALATLPFALVTVAAALSTLPLALLMARRGRRGVFMLGAFVGAVGGAAAAWSIVFGSFVVFCGANFALGLFQACAQYYRFAATEAVDAAFKPRAVGWVVGAGVVAAVLGPALANGARDALGPNTFAGSYLAVVALALLSIASLSRLTTEPRTPCAPPASLPQSTAATPLWSLLRQPGVAPAIANGVLAYALMMFVMTATPLAVLGCGGAVGDAATVIQWHLVAMFAPGLVTGRLIARWGESPILLSGACLLAVGGVVAISSLSLMYFGLALALNGLAWNFMFVGATSLLVQSLGAASAVDRARVQAFNEFATFIVVAVASLLAGTVFDGFGWSAIQTVVLPGAALAAGITLRRSPQASRCGAGQSNAAPL